MGENVQVPKTFVGLNKLAAFPPDAQESVKPGRWYIKASKKGKAPTNEHHRHNLWFSTEPLTAFDAQRPKSIQLITYSHGKAEEATAKGSTWFEIRICSNPDDAKKGISKKVDGQKLEWFSHAHQFQSEEEEWCLGRVFMHDENILSHVEENDIIAVYICASGDHFNHAKEGYLTFDYGSYKGCGIHLELPDPKNSPEVLVYGENRRECLMTPVSNTTRTSAKNAVFVDGGVDLMDRLLQNDAKNWKVQKHYLESKSSTLDPHTIFELEGVKKNKKGEKVTSGDYETAKQYTLLGSNTSPLPAQNLVSETKPKIIVWNDFGVLRDEATANTARSDARLLIYQMQAPVFQGTLWEKAVQATMHQVELKHKHSANAKKGSQKVLIVIDAEDLRAHGFHISRRVSWEKTMEDFRAHFPEFIKDIHKDMHVIVRLGYEGAIYVPLKSGITTNAHARFQFDCYLVPDKIEGDLLRTHNRNIPGIDMAFLAGLTASLVRESNDSLNAISETQVQAAVDLGLAWSHRFAAVRFCKDSNGILNYPCPKHFDNEKIKPKLIPVKAEEMGTDGNWSLFNRLANVRNTVSSEIVTKGSTAWLEGEVPTARFGNLLTADRKEIECFRSTAAVIDEYLASPPGKPLSLAVFGSPGAGKSFGVKEVIKTMLPDAKGPIEVNLSQFMNHSELLSTFHNIRDMALAGDMPVVMFDEFDSVFEQQELGWLKYFLAPMQDGYFLEDGQQRSLKKAIFIFVGGTSSNWAEFTQGMDKDADQRPGSPAGGDVKTEKEKEDKDKKAKKPDFVSRLSAYIDIRGLNKMGNNDEMYKVRRAMILRSTLAGRLDLRGKDIPIDGRVLNALLEQEKFRHGARSISLILQMSALSGRAGFEASALPSDEQLAMHLDVAKFKDNIRMDLHGDKGHAGEAENAADNNADGYTQIDVELRRVLMSRPRD
ncbi:uncharacterized protein FIESC28_01488 [Fusarium coffeatum]|uniref:ATPase AAA-type core domain-containing protein n=1 Tax=Fusarium coffeatum TaxID=231269 RepID=A0A366SAU2_9HYPO|nr:uncharacterized protein FIESC28_01488 [Fusarium coffeatum]RBR25735.1 hypothetical protein FIESC28_01488 [Fusarium coffeatum]